jgi:hypothetical protein
MAILLQAARRSKASTFALQFCGAVALSGCVGPLKHVVAAPITRAFIGPATKRRSDRLSDRARELVFERKPVRNVIRDGDWFAQRKTHQKSESLRSD